MFANFPWNEFFIIWGLGVLGGVLVLPYAFELNKTKLEQVKLSRPVLVAITIVQTAVLLGLATGIGLLAAEAVGLGAPLISAWVAGEAVWADLAALLPISVGLGLLSGVLIVALELILFHPRLPEALRGLGLKGDPFKGFLASFYGGFSEEILLRLFVFSVIAWALGLFWQGPDGMPAAGAYWAANLLAAVLFGLGHLPATAAVTPLTPLIVTRAVVLNGVGGVIFGLLYWRYGLEAAMIAHFSADIVLHVITPLFFLRKSEELAQT
jgi:hypothetical protein